MSKRYPIIAVTGSSGAGTTTVKVAFEHIFYRLQVNAAFMEGDSFHRHNRAEMREVVAKAQGEGRTLSHFGAEANLFEELEELFRQYSQTGRRQSPSARNQGPSPPGRTSQRTRISCFMKGCMGQWSPRRSMWRSM